MADSKTILEQLRRICLALPDTKETLTWGEPHFRVGDKIFAGFGEEQGQPTIGFKLEKPHAHARIDNRRFFRAPYVGQHGWVSMRAAGKFDWDEVREYVQESYRLIAPKASRAKFEAGAAPASQPARKSGAGNEARKAPAARSSSRRS